MKPDETENAETVEIPPAGDVIGDTAYSERFVLKILIKLANLDTLKDEVHDKTFEDDLCTLMDMSAERDVVLFLQKHKILNLIDFALPSIDNPRIIEIILGIIGNMCCQQETATVLLEMDPFSTTILEHIKSDDSMILIQVLRLVSASLYQCNEYDLEKWMVLFKKTEYSNAMFFILKNSSNKEVLSAALENFNTIATYYNSDKFRGDYFISFVTVEALESLSAAFVEIVVTQKDSVDTEELERILVISLQITLNLVGFDKSAEIYKDNKEDVLKIVTTVLAYYENKLVNQKEIDADLVDIIESTTTIAHILVLSEVSQPDQYLLSSFRIWKAIKSLTLSESNGSDFDDVSNQLQNFAANVKVPLSILICSYIEKCHQSDLVKVLDELSSEYDDIVNAVTDDKLKENVLKRCTTYRSRLKDNVDS